MVLIYCLIAATILPYVWATLSTAIRKKEFGSLDNNNPRVQQAKLTGPGARAYAAQQNAWEALAVFAPAAIVAWVGNPTSSLVAPLGLAWLGLRVLHGVFYVADKATPRSACFAMAMLCAVALFLVGAEVI